MTRTVYTALAALALVLPGVAQAQTVLTTSAKQEVVSYADLDLSREDGAKVLLARIEAAAARVCGPAPIITNLKFHAIYKGCLHDTMDRTVMSVGSPLVAKVYTGMKTETVAQN